jgi:hypothetical protein
MIDAAKIHSAKVGKNMRGVKYQIAILCIVSIEFLYLSWEAVFKVIWGSGSFFKDQTAVQAYHHAMGGPLDASQ